MRNSVTIFFLFVLCLIVFAAPNNLKAQISSPGITVQDPEHIAEDLWASVDFISIQKSIADSTKMSATDLQLFMQYISVKFDYDERSFFQSVLNGTTSAANLPQYIQLLTNKYISTYPDFQKIKLQFALLQNSSKNKTLSVNGPCVNTDFSDSSTVGWTSYLAKACSTSPTPCTPVTQVAGYTGSRMSIVAAGTFDPYITTLSRVAPGKTYAVHMEDYLNGGNATMLTQTFMVTATNNIFTYQYAVVLEDPGTTNAHTQAQRPYFKVRMQDDLGNEITCADYTVWAMAPYKNFIHHPVPNPNPGLNGSGNTLDLYYRDWTTVSIPLLGYIGRNVTIEFMASDCSLGGHLGYAYLDATCSYLTPVIPPLICGTTENFTVHGPINFAAYQWSGPGIIGSTTADSIVLNKAGTYSVLLTPVADNPCPVTVSVVVPQRCLPTPVTAKLCETTLGSGKTTGINLAKYNALITSYNSSGTVKSWHSALPAKASNIITTPSSLTVQTGSTYYAVIAYPVPGGDTAQISFTVNPLPNVQIPAVGPLCQNSSSINLAGTPAGGIYSGQYITASGVFNPSTVGSFRIKYTVTTVAGCVDSAITNIVVNGLPTVNAGLDQKLCSTTTSVNLSGTVTNDSIIKWSGGAGTFSSPLTAASVYTPTAAEIASGSVTLTLTVTGKKPCIPVSDQIVIRFVPILKINAGPDQKLCNTSTTVSLSGTATNDSIVKWTGGSGTFSSTSIANPVYTPTATELNGGTITLTLTGTGKLPCPVITDEMVIRYSKEPTVNAGPDQKLCSIVTTVNLNGIATNDSIVKWSGGAGSFSSLSTVTSVYTPTATEIASGSVTLTLTVTGKLPCIPVTDQMVIRFVPTPTVNAGLDQKLCNTTTIVNLNGTATNDSIVTWSGGAGTFSSIFIMNPLYTPTATELNGGTVTLTLTSTGKSPCVAVTDQMVIRFVPTPAVNAGLDQKLCSTVTTVNLNGTATNDSIVKWTGGKGTFSSTSITNPVYTPTATELNGGTVTLTLTSTGNLPCTVISDQMVIRFVPTPTLNAGPDQKLCNTATIVNLNGTATNDSITTWSGGSGTFSSISIVSPVYTPTATELNGGTVTLTLTATGKYPCTSITDQMIIQFVPTPTVNAGSDQKLCNTVNSVNLIGTATNDSVVKWTGGAGTFSSISIVNTVYTPTATELNGGTVMLTLTNTGNLPCSVITDRMIVHFVATPTVNAGPDQKLCSTTTSVNLKGTVTNDSAMVWSGGTGTFSSTTTATTVYTPTASEITNGSITLKLTSLANTPCLTISDSLVILYNLLPAVNAGPDQTICNTATSVNLGGVATNDSIVKWTGGTGTFSSASIINPLYTPSAAELSGGIISLTLTATGNLPCPIVTDKMIIRFNKVVTANAGPDQKLCSTTTSVKLNGTVTNDSAMIWSGGSGTFSSTATATTIYTPTPAEMSNSSITLVLTSFANAPCPSISDTVVVLYNMAPTVNAGPDQKVCSSGTLINLNGLVSNDSVVKWTGGAGIFSSRSSAVTTYIPAPTEINGMSITFTLTVIAKSPCPQVLGQVQVLISPVPAVNAGLDQTLCNLLTTLQLSGSALNDTVAVWSGGAGTFSSTTTLNPTYIPTTTEINSGSITLTLTVYGKSPCPQVSDQVTFTGIPVPVVKINDTSVCQGQTVTLNAHPSNLNYYKTLQPVYTWYKNNIQISGSGETIQINSAGNYTVSVSVGGCIGKDSMLFTVYPLPSPNLPQLIQFCPDTLTSVLLTAGQAQSYIWKPTGETSQTIVVSQTGVYSVTLTNQFKCSASASTLVREVCPPRLFVGNAFSPNKDGINDVFTVYGVHIGKYQLLIFNRWGEIIFESTDVHFSWDGYYKGELMPIGVYPWIISYTGDSPEYSELQKLDGSVTVVK